MLEVENSSSESSIEEVKINKSQQDPTCDIVSSHRNTEAKKLKRGVYKFFQGGSKKHIQRKLIKERHKELDTTGNHSQYINGSMTKATSSKFILKSIDDSEARLTGPLANPKEKFMKKNSIFYRVGLDKVEEESDISAVPCVTGPEDRLSHISLIHSQKVSLSCATKGLFFNLKDPKGRRADKQDGDIKRLRGEKRNSKRKIGPKLDFGKSKIKHACNGDKDTPRIKKPSLVSKDVSKELDRPRSLEKELESPKKGNEPRSRGRRKGRFNTSFHINKSIMRPTALKREHMEYKHLQFNTHTLLSPCKLKKSSKKKKKTVINGILKPSSFVKMRKIKEDLLESMKVIDRRVKKMNERKAKKKVKFNKKMLVYKYKAKRTLTTSFEYEKRGWKKDTERHFSKDF